jgi:hypothetical protein
LASSGTVRPAAPPSTATAQSQPTLLPFILTPPAQLSDLASRIPELSDILRDPALNSVYKDFLIAYQQGGPDAAIDLAHKRGILTPQNEIRATLILDVEYDEQLVKQLESIGVVVESAYKTQIDIAVPLAVIQHSIDSGSPGAIFQRLTALQHVIRVKLPDKAGSDACHTSPARDGVTGQGVQVIGADAWHRAGFSGAGVKIGILDCGFKGYKTLLGTELPPTVTAHSFVRGLIDPDDSDDKHGTAVAEVVYETVPEAELYLADYGCRGGPPLGRAVEWLLQQDVQIISSSTGSPAAPMDGTGWQADLVNEAAAQDVLWVNSIGNSAAHHFRGDWTDSDGDDYHEFSADQEALAFTPQDTQVEMTLRWNDWRVTDQDFDLMLLDTAGAAVASSREPQAGAKGDTPVETISYDGLTVGGDYFIAIYANHATRPVTFDLYVEGDGLLALATPEHSLISPADASGALAVGAFDWDTGRVTDYSSRGPTDDGRVKPDISAPTGVDTVPITGLVEPRPRRHMWQARRRWCGCPS